MLEHFSDSPAKAKNKGKSPEKYFDPMKSSLSPNFTKKSLKPHTKISGTGQTFTENSKKEIQARKAEKEDSSISSRILSPSSDCSIQILPEVGAESRIWQTEGVGWVKHSLSLDIQKIIVNFSDPISGKSIKAWMTYTLRSPKSKVQIVKYCDPQLYKILSKSLSMNYGLLIADTSLLETL